MAGGIDWFRWHHGSVTDPKFQLVAKKARVSLPAVIAVWAFLLEQASAADDRGTIGVIDAESLDCMFGLEEGDCARVLEHMNARGLLENGAVASWEKRQPKRERDDNSAERTRAYRERQRQQSDDTERHVTPCDATERQKKPRGEESREEEKKERTHAPSTTPAGRVCSLMKGEGIGDVNPGHPDLLALLEAGATDDEFVGAARAAQSKGKGFTYTLGTLKRQRQDAADLSKRLHRGAMPQAPPTETAYARSMREKVASFAPAIAAKAPGQLIQIDAEVTDVTSRIVG